VRVPAFIDVVRKLAPDLIVVVAFGQILPQSLLDIPRHGCINVHASLLPAYRGAAPLNWCIINGETETGVTTMLMDAGHDTGDILLRKRTPIAPDEDSLSLHDRLSALGAEAMTETLDLLGAGRLVPEKQIDSLSSYAPMLKKEDGLIDWDRPALAIKNLVRGMTPWPGAFFWLDGRTLKICRAEAATGSGRPGSVLRADRTGLEVACGAGSLLVLELQLEGKKRLTAREFLTGYKIAPGTILGERKAFSA
jgi:methionyl-tRNA formyltransferase